ncbi:unnamed protein product [Victoria cruziana]
MDAISFSLLSSFPLPSPNANLFRLTLPPITNVRKGERPQTELRTQSRTTAPTTPTTTVETPPSKSNGRRAEAPSPSAEQARPVGQPHRVASPPSLPVRICNFLDDLINNFINRPLRSSINPREAP